jgi:DsbC/DsbD-like thiol-disulfide interchange protein
MKLALTALIVALGACQSAPAPERELHPVTAELLADVTGVQSSQMFTLGVQLKMKPGWHVYWKNPGDSGLPVSITVTGPEGSTGVADNWPVPIEFVQPGDIVGYGYTDTVMFPIAVRAPKVPPGTTLQYTADVRWLCCKDVCIPGHTTLEISVPVTDAPAPAANAAVFAEWRDRLPVTGLASAEVAGRIDPATRRGAFSVAVAWKTPPARVEWFPEADPALEVSNVKIATEGALSRVTFDAHIFEGQQLATNDIGSLVVSTDARGSRRGVPVRIRLQ